jgi:serine/threonine protein kinase
MIIFQRNKNIPRIAKKKNNRIKSTKIGAGTFGTISIFMDDYKNYAIKSFTYSDDPLHLTTLREIKSIMSIKSQYIVEILEIIENDYRIEMVMPFYEFDLHRLLGKENFTLTDLKNIFWQVLMGVRDIHNAGYLHRDLKSANILINKKSLSNKKACVSVDDQSEIADRRNEDAMTRKLIPGMGNICVDSNYEARICDFGLARTKAIDMTPYIMTLWYRAPEVLLGSSNYTKSIDVWSLGCILLEMLKKTPIFKAETEVDMLNLIVEICGSINEKTLPGYNKLPLYGKYVISEGKRCIKETFSSISQEAADLADKMLIINPDKRPTIDECLSHPFFQVN